MNVDSQMGEDTVWTATALSLVVGRAQASPYKEEAIQFRNRVSKFIKKDYVHYWIGLSRFSRSS